MVKTITRILLVVVIGCVIYFATIGRDDWYRLVETINDAIQVIGANYLKK
jgi:hypothetical protein